VKAKTRFDERVGIFLNIERSTRDLAKHLHLSDTQAYTKGVMDTASERESELSEQQMGLSIQNDRELLKTVQDRIAHKERVALDARIRDQTRKRQKTITIKDDLGQEILAVYAK
jgi:glycyl-tRNA synthetase (class II)